MTTYAPIPSTLVQDAPRQLEWCRWISDPVTDLHVKWIAYMGQPDEGPDLAQQRPQGVHGVANPAGVRR
jgi:hypothetical protein